jgi:hypothetical protein
MTHAARLTQLRAAKRLPANWTIIDHWMDLLARFPSDCKLDFQVLVNAETVQVAASTQVSGNACRLRWSTQHLLGVYSPETENRNQWPPAHDTLGGTAAATHQAAHQGQIF